MNKKLLSLGAALLLAAALPFAAQAKLPAPVMTPEAQAKAAEAKAKTDHGNKVAAFKLCQAMDRAAANHFKTVGANAKPATPTAACADPGAFVYTPAPAAAAPAAKN